MPDARKCPSCGADLPSDSPAGQCIECLLRLGFSQPEQDQSPCLPVPGQMFGRYKIARQLGKGGMGIVYEAVDEVNNRRVALKVLRAGFDSDDAKARFLREGQLAASINHQNCVYVFAAEEIENQPVIAMEMIPGGTLADQVEMRGPLPVQEAVQAILDVVSGLEAARAAGVLHRDVKPCNCFRESNGRVKIGDFGISISRTHAAAEGPGRFIGTPAYASPEQLRGEALDFRADIYSVGVTLYYLLTAKLPFDGDNFAELRRQVEKIPFVWPRGSHRAAFYPLTNIVERCLHKNPSGRFQRYSALSKSLDKLVEVNFETADPNIRLVAAVFDVSLIAFGLFSLAWSLRLITAMFGVSSPLAQAVLHPDSAGDLLTFCLTFSIGQILYFAITEAWWGASLGKGLLMKVVDSRFRPPTFPRALARATLFSVVVTMPGFFGALCLHKPAHESAILFLAGQTFGAGLLMIGRSKEKANILWHDRLTSTRTVSLRRPRPDQVPKAAPPPLPDRLSPPLSETFQPIPCHRLIAQGSDWKIVEKWDSQLKRKLWIREFFAFQGIASTSATRQRVDRRSRLRWIDGRHSDSERWDAYEAPQGTPLMARLERACAWADVRCWLLELAEEISVAVAEGTMPPNPTITHVWITSDQHASILDFPIPGTIRDTDSDQNVSPAQTEPPIQLVYVVGRAALAVGFARRKAGSSEPEDEPWPHRATQFIERADTRLTPSVVAERLRSIFAHTSIPYDFAMNQRRIHSYICAPVFAVWTVIGLCMVFGQYPFVLLDGFFGESSFANGFLRFVPSFLLIYAARGSAVVAGGYKVVGADSRDVPLLRRFVRILPGVGTAILGLLAGILPDLYKLLEAVLVPKTWLSATIPNVLLLLGIGLSLLSLLQLCFLRSRRNLLDRIAGTWVVPA